MAFSLRLPLLLLIAIIPLSAEEWYMRDSHLISDVQFDTNIKKSHNNYKIVKFFTPFCRYCKDLKQVFDHLKQTQTFTVQFYDFNCQWYPQFCFTQVHASSFPYVGIYDREGNLIEQIHGFYPQPVIKGILDRIQVKNQEGVPIKQETQQKSSLKKVQQKQNQVETHVGVKPIPLPTSSEQLTLKPEDIALKKEEQNPQQQQKTQQNKKIRETINTNEIESETKKPTLIVDEATPVTQQKLIYTSEQSQKHANIEPAILPEGDSIFKYIFYLCCLSLGAYYFYSVTHTKEQSHDQIHSQVKHMPSNSSGPIQQEKVAANQKQIAGSIHQVKYQEQQLLKTLRDDEL